MELPEPNERIIEETFKLLSTAWLMGMQHAAPNRVNFDFADAIGHMVFDEALERALTRPVVTNEVFSQLPDHLKQQSYTVGRLAQLELLEKAKKHYLEQFTAESTSVEQYVNSIDYVDISSKVGLAGYYETVYRTNIQNDYNAGRAMQFQEDPPTLLEFIGIEDDRQSDICAARTGIVLPYTDPFWDTNWPPLHFNCRSTVRGIYETEAEKYGRKDEREARTALNIKNVANTKTVGKSGFGRNPTLNNAYWETSTHQQSVVIKDQIQEELNSVAGQTVCKYFKDGKEGHTVKMMDNDKGGVMWPDDLPEFEEKNKEIAEALAKDKGYFIKLQNTIKGIKGNKSADAIFNNFDKWELKDFAKAGKTTMEKTIEYATSQASNLAVRIQYGGQLKDLRKALIKIIPEIKESGRTINTLAVVFKDKVVYLSWDDLQLPETIISKLTNV